MQELGMCEVHLGDLFSLDALATAAAGAEVVFHLAASTDADAKSRDAIERCFALNVQGTKNLLSALGPSVRHVVFFSTAHVFGAQRGEGIDETWPAEPDTVYGRSKLEAENLVREWGSRHGVMTTCLRLPLVYGPGNKGNMLRMIDAVARRRFLIIGNGENKRSMVYVDNVVDAAIAVANRTGADAELFIVTDGADYSLQHLYQTIALSLGMKPLATRIPLGVARLGANAADAAGRVLGREAPYGTRALDKMTSSLTFSSRKIEQALGFQPAHDLSKGMAETARWYRERKR